MSGKAKKYLTIFSLVLVAVISLIGYQNCSRILLVGQSEKASMGGGGNGDGYEGKPDKIFVQNDMTMPCSEIGANGQPLPNREIFYYQSLSYSYLVRRDCADIAPEKIQNADLQVDLTTNTVIYQGLTYSLQPPGDFSVVAASCPTGTSPIPSVTRTNLFADSQNLAGSSWWFHEGLEIPPQLVGTIAGIPSWAVRRVGTLMDFYRRARRIYNVTAGTQYALSYLVRSGTKQAVSIHLWQWQRSSYIFEVDLNNGAVTITDNQGITNPVVVTTPIAGGYFITLYFTPQSTWELDMGPTPQARYPFGVAGDEVHVTAAQLETVSSYCQ